MNRSNRHGGTNMYDSNDTSFSISDRSDQDQLNQSMNTNETDQTDIMDQTNDAPSSASSSSLLPWHQFTVGDLYSLDINELRRIDQQLDKEMDFAERKLHDRQQQVKEMRERVRNGEIVLRSLKARMTDETKERINQYKSHMESIRPKSIEEAAKIRIEREQDYIDHGMEEIKERVLDEMQDRLLSANNPPESILPSSILHPEHEKFSADRKSKLERLRADVEGMRQRKAATIKHREERLSTLEREVLELPNLKLKLEEKKKELEKVRLESTKAKAETERAQANQRVWESFFHNSDSPPPELLNDPDYQELMEERTKRIGSNGGESLDSIEEGIRTVGLAIEGVKTQLDWYKRNDPTHSTIVDTNQTSGTKHAETIALVPARHRVTAQPQQIQQPAQMIHHQPAHTDSSTRNLSAHNPSHYDRLIAPGPGELRLTTVGPQIVRTLPSGPTVSAISPDMNQSNNFQSNDQMDDSVMMTDELMDSHMGMTTLMQPTFQQQPYQLQGNYQRQSQQQQPNGYRGVGSVQPNRSFQCVPQMNPSTVRGQMQQQVPISYNQQNPMVRQSSMEMQSQQQPLSAGMRHSHLNPQQRFPQTFIPQSTIMQQPSNQSYQQTGGGYVHAMNQPSTAGGTSVPTAGRITSQYFPASQ